MSSLTKEEAFTNLWKGVTDIVVARLHQAREYVVEETDNGDDPESLDSWLSAQDMYGNTLVRLAGAVFNEDFDEVVNIYVKALNDNYTIEDIIFQTTWFQTHDVTFV